MFDLGVITLPTLFPPSLPLTPSSKSAFYLLIGRTLQIGGLFPSPHPTSPLLQEEE